MNLDKCSEVITHKIIVLVDPKGKKCDYLLKIEQPLIEIYVELKGSHVKDALEQLENTIKQISNNYQKLLKYCYIIHQRCPMSGTDIQNSKKHFKKCYNAYLEVKKSGFEVNLKDILPN